MSWRRVSLTPHSLRDSPVDAGNLGALFGDHNWLSADRASPALSDGEASLDEDRDPVGGVSSVVREIRSQRRSRSQLQGRITEDAVPPPEVPVHVHHDPHYKFSNLLTREFPAFSPILSLGALHLGWGQPQQRTGYAWSMNEQES